MAAEVEPFEDAAGEFRLRLQAENNKIIPDSAEGLVREREQHGTFSE